jgi:RHS repeat-associated protein
VAGLGNYLYRDDTKGRLSEVVSPLLTSGANTWIFKYDKDGKEIERRHPNGTGGAGAREVSIYTTDGRDFLNKVELYDSANTLKDRLTYAYGPAGNLISEADLGGRVHGFSYDNLYRLKQETHPDFGPAGSGQSIDYRYDANGNRTQKIVNGGVGANGYTDYYGADGRDRLWWVNRRNGEPTSGQTAPYTIYNYDANGNTVYRERRHDATTLRKLALIWDSDDRLKRVWQDDGTNVTSIFNGLYDEDGLRVQKTDSWTGTHNYSWGPGGIVHDTAGTSYTPGLHQQSGGTDRFFHSDWLGSTRYLSDSAGTGLPSALRYDAFGNRSATGGTDAYHSTDFQFAGASGYQQEYASATEPGLGLQYLEQRYYDPAVGRFISPDPIGFAGGLNLYGYAGGDPVNGVDPSGLDDADYILKDNPRGVQPTARVLLPAINKGAGYARAGLEMAASATVAGRACLAVDKVREGDYVGAALLAAPDVLRFARGGLQKACSAIGGFFRRGKSAPAGLVVEAGTAASPTVSLASSKRLPNFDQARREAFENAGMTDPAKVKFSKVDPETGTVVEFKGPGGAKVSYDGPHAQPGPGHETQHVGWQSAGKRKIGGRRRGNIPYGGPQHPSRPSTKGAGDLGPE